MYNCSQFQSTHIKGSTFIILSAFFKVIPNFLFSIHKLPKVPLMKIPMQTLSEISQYKLNLTDILVPYNSHWTYWSKETNESNMFTLPETYHQNGQELNIKIYAI